MYIKRQIIDQKYLAIQYRQMRKKQSQLTSEESFGEKLLYKKQNTLQVPKTNKNVFGNKKPTGMESHSSLYRLTYFLKGFMGCIGGFMIHLVIGSLYQWGLISPYITSYFKLKKYPDLEIKDMGIIFPIMMFCIGVTMKIGLDLGSKFGYWKVLLVNFLGCSIFVWFSSYFVNLFVFVLLYSLAFGLMAGMTFMVPMRVCNQYFPNKQTYVNGFILIGTGLGSVVFGVFSINFVNPDKKDPIDGYYVDPTLQDIPQKIPQCIRWLAILYLITGVIGSLLLRPLEQFNHAQEEMQKTIISQTLVKRIPNDSGQCLSCVEAIKSSIFWIHVLIIVLGCCGNLFINSNYKPFAKGKIVDDQFLTLVGLIGSVGNGVSRFFWSSLFNRVGYKNVTSIILFLNIVCLGTLRFTVQTQAVYLIVVFILNCCLGGLLVMAPTFSSTIFGKEVGPKIFGAFWCSFAIGNFLQYLFVISIQPHIGLGGIIYICLGMNVLNVFIIVGYDFKAKWNNDLKFFTFKTRPKYEIVKDENQLLIYSVVSNRVKQQDVMNSIISGKEVYYT